MIESLGRSIKNIVENAGDAVVLLVAGVVMPAFGRESRQFWADGLELDAWNDGSSTRGSRASLAFFPKAERMEARSKIDKALISYWKRKARPS